MDIDSHEEDVLRLVSEACNREILTVLDHAGRPLHVDRLAERLAAHEVPADGSSASENRLESVRISLHHDRLPRLADAGLVEYDREENVVARRTDVADGVEWTDHEFVDELLARFHTGDETDDSSVGVIEGREEVIEYGRRLADEAEEELFLMYVSGDLLEAECLRRAEDAIERGVDIYLGSQNPSVRELTRRNLPEVTIWEPQLDWTNVPSSYPKVGRLVLADRETVMLALLDDRDSDSDLDSNPDPGVGSSSDSDSNLNPNSDFDSSPDSDSDDASAETALIGEGEDNPLVVLVRDLLGPRLDHLDYQSEDFQSQLPF